jgi:PhnB protein
MFNGNCEEAFNLYATTFGGEIKFKMTYSQAPADNQCGADMASKIMHISMCTGESALMGSDAPPDRFTAPSTGNFTSISAKTPEEAERIYAALSDGANIIMAIEETFWAQRFAMLVDRFGIPWMINCEKQM